MIRSLAQSWKLKRLQSRSSRRLGPVQRRRRQWLAVRCWSIPTLVLVLLVAPRWVVAQDGPQVALSKSVYPTTVASGGRVSYTITLTNSGNAAAEGVTVHDTLPDGFTYCHGTSVVTVNGVTVSVVNPAVSGRTLTWSSLPLPSGRSGSVYGIHTFVHSRWNPCDYGYIDYQLDHSRELMGVGSYVTQLFDWIEPSWQGPLSCWRDFVTRAYDRGLTPVVRLQGPNGPPWIKPKRDPDGSYGTWVHAFKKVVEGLPRRDGYYLYVQVWNEPNLHAEWEGQANAAEYGQFFVETANAIRSLHDPHVKVLNGPLSPGATSEIGVGYLDYLEALLDVPGAIDAFDVWASHPYPNNHPPEYNIHDGTADYHDATIDLYQRELEILARRGRSGVKVLLTETGYALYQADFAYEGYPAVSEANRADYIQRAFRDYWSQWPEVMGVCPYELVDPRGEWWVWDWLYKSGQSHQQYDAIRAMNKTYTPASSVLRITFEATAASSAGTYYNEEVSATASNATIPPATNVAPVAVYVPTPTRTSTALPTLTPTLTPTTTPAPTPTPTGPQAPTATMTPSVTPSSTAPQTPSVTITPAETPVCVDLIVNGGFETTGAWEIAVPGRAEYTTAQAHGGQRSMRVGIESGDNVRSYSSAYQQIHVPADAPDPVLAFWYYPVSGDIENDHQYAVIQDQHDAIQEWIFSLHSNGQSWEYRELALADYRGMTIRIRFGVYNEGSGGVTAMYVDDVAVLVCGLTPTRTASPTAWAAPSATSTETETPTPTNSPTKIVVPTPSATATPTPGPTPGCTDLIVDGGFELEDQAWEILIAGRADYTTAYAHSGQRSMRVGIESGSNVYSYSTVRQTVHLPATVQDPVLAFWYHPVSGDTEHDLQYVRVEDEDGSSNWVLRERSNTQLWTYKEHHLAANYKGKNITIYFGVLNDGSGGVTAMYVDDVSLPICALQPTPSATPGGSLAQVFLPMILHPHGEERGQSKAVSAELMALPGSAARVRTLWAPAEADRDPDSLQGVAFNPTNDSLFVAAGKAVWVLDARTGTVAAHIPLGAQPRALAVDTATNRIYAALWEAGALAVIDGQRQVLCKTVPGIPGASGVALSQDHVYVTATRSDELVVVDRQNYAIISRILVGDAPYAVACDSARQRAYVGNAGGDTVSIVDGHSGALLNTVKLGGLGHPHGLAFDPVRDRLYVTYALTPKYRAIAAIDASSGQILSRLVGNEKRPLFGAYGIAVDPLRGRVYVTTVDDVLVLAGETLRVAEAIRGLGPAYAFGLCTNPVEGHLYIVDAQHARLAVWGN